MSDPLWERLVVAAVGPAVTAILALFVVNAVTNRVQRRRDENEVREMLSLDITRTANELYFALQAFWRAARDVPLAKRALDPTLEKQREQLEAAYTRARVEGQMIERRLHIYYKSRCPAKAWHRVFDLLSTRYFLLLEADPTKRIAVRKRNAGADHSGLSENDLNKPELLLCEIRSSVPRAIESLWRHPVDRRGKHLDLPGSVRSTWHDDYPSQAANHDRGMQ